MVEANAVGVCYTLFNSKSETFLGLMLVCVLQALQQKVPWRKCESDVNPIETLDFKKPHIYMAEEVQLTPEVFFFLFSIFVFSFFFGGGRC